MKSTNVYQWIVKYRQFPAHQHELSLLLFRKLRPRQLSAMHSFCQPLSIMRIATVFSDWNTRSFRKCILYLCHCILTRVRSLCSWVFLLICLWSKTSYNVAFLDVQDFNLFPQKHNVRYSKMHK